MCFLSQAYGHAFDIILSFTQVPLGSEVLVQIDRLVQLLETPCFAMLRLHLLEPSQQPLLHKAMYGLLMLLPQSNAFRTLHSRLHCLPTLALLQMEKNVSPTLSTGETQV
jgi:vacuole morphology and inheritance protein 14